MTPPTFDRCVVSLQELLDTDHKLRLALQQRDNARFWQGIWIGVALMLAVALVLVLAGGAK